MDRWSRVVADFGLGMVREDGHLIGMGGRGFLVKNTEIVPPYSVQQILNRI